MFFSYKKKIISFFSLFVQLLLLSSSYTLLTSQKSRSLPIYDSNQTVQKNGTKQSAKVGNFQLYYDNSTQYPELQQILQNSGIYEEAIRELNKKRLNLPVDIPVIFTDCGSSNAFYDPQKKRVLMCHELFVEMFGFFKSQNLSSEEALIKSMETGTLVLFHEVGHALVNVLQLAITGKEEDTVDDFAALILLDDNNVFPEEILITGGSFFLSSQSDIPYWSQHSFGQQRFYNWICMLYGKNPQKYANISQKLDLGESRARRCSREYQQKILSWQRLLAPHSLNDVNRPSVNTNNNNNPLY